MDKRHRNAGDDGRPDIAQEQENNHHHQHDGQHQREFNILDRSADRGGAIGRDTDRGGGRNDGAQLRQHGLDPVNSLDDVRAGLPVNGHDHGRFAVGVSGVANVRDSLGDSRDVAEPDRSAVTVSHDQRSILLGLDEQLVGGEQESIDCPGPRYFPWGCSRLPTAALVRTASRPIP